MKFDIGDKVVHPQHGVGTIVDIVLEEINTEDAKQYYILSIPDITLWVPVDLDNTGIRKLGSKSEIDKCRQILMSDPTQLESGRGLVSSLVYRIRQGTILSHCEVVRDLAAYGWKKSLFGTLADFRDKGIKVFCQEWAEIENISFSDASSEIYALLKKGKLIHFIPIK